MNVLGETTQHIKAVHPLQSGVGRSGSVCQEFQVSTVKDRNNLAPDGGLNRNRNGY